MEIETTEVSQQQPDLEQQLVEAIKQRDDALSQVNSMRKLDQIVQVFRDKGIFNDPQAAARLVADQISRTADGSLVGVDEAIAFIKKAHSGQIRRVAAPAPKPLGKTYVPASPSDEAAVRRYFGPGSDSRLANNLALTNIKEYRRLREIARELLVLA